jgi:hypothetical protein
MGVKEGAAYGLGVTFGLISYYSSAESTADYIEDPNVVTTADNSETFGQMLAAYGIQVVTAGGFQEGHLLDNTDNYNVIVQTRTEAFNTLTKYGLGTIFYLGMFLGIAEGQASNNDTVDEESALEQARNCVGELQGTYSFLNLQSLQITGQQAISGLRQAYQQDFIDWDVYVGIDTQSNWRYCQSCAGLVFAGNSTGVCPAGPKGTPHNTAGSWNFGLMINTPYLPGQHDWQYCSKCQALFFSAGGTSVCPALGTHDGAGSGDYILIDSGPGQSDWQYCDRCQGMFWPGYSKGVCPATQSGHDSSGSGGYVLTYTTS